MAENYFLQEKLFRGTTIEEGFWLCELQISVALHLIFMIIHLQKV